MKTEWAVEYSPANNVTHLRVGDHITLSLRGDWVYAYEKAATRGGLYACVEFYVTKLRFAEGWPRVDGLLWWETAKRRTVFSVIGEEMFAELGTWGIASVHVPEGADADSLIGLSCGLLDRVADKELATALTSANAHRKMQRNE